MYPRIGSTVLVSSIAFATDITRVVKQRTGDTGYGETFAETISFQSVAVIAVDKPGHGQGHVEHVLTVMVFDVAGVKTGILARVKSGEISKQCVDEAKLVITGVAPLQHATNFSTDGDGIGNIDAITHIHVGLSMPPVIPVSILSYRLGCTLAQHTGQVVEHGFGSLGLTFLRLNDSTLLMGGWLCGWRITDGNSPG